MASAEFDTPDADASGIIRWDITTPEGQPPLRVYRRTVPLRIHSAGSDTRVRVVMDGAVLQGSFKLRDYTVTSAFQDLGGGVVKVTLDAPRRLRAVRLKSDAPGAGSKLEFLRLDGNTPAEDATTSATVTGMLATLGASDDFTDARFALRLEDSTSLEATHIDHLALRSYPTGARLGLRGPDSESPPVFFWQVPGEIGKMLPAEQGNVDAGARLKQELDRLLPSLDQPLPEELELALVIESDAPCIFEATTLSATYRFTLDGFAPDEDDPGQTKQVLRFGQDQGTPRTVSIRLPRLAQVHAATVEATESFRPDRATPENGSTPPALSQKAGVHITAERWVAQQFTAKVAQTASGIVLGLMALAGNTEVLVEIQEDWQGRPSGRKLASGTIAVPNPGVRRWAALRFADSLTLPAQPHWILVQAASGQALWLTDEGDRAARVLEPSSQTATWIERSVFAGRQALSLVMTRGNVTGSLEPVRLTVGSQTVAAAHEDNRKVYDLASALNTYLNALPAAGTGASEDESVEIPLTFTGTVPGLMTVYPPRVEFDS